MLPILSSDHLEDFVLFLTIFRLFQGSLAVFNPCLDRWFVEHFKSEESVDDASKLTIQHLVDLEVLLAYLFTLGVVGN